VKSKDPDSQIVWAAAIFILPTSQSIPTAVEPWISSQRRYQAWWCSETPACIARPFWPRNKVTPKGR